MSPTSAPVVNRFFSCLKAGPKESGMVVPLYLGRSKEKEIWIDMVRNPHLLIAGSTGSGKSSLLQVLIANALIGSDLQIYIIDTKGIEFQEYENNDRIQIIGDYPNAVDLIKCLIHEMEYRYVMLRMKKMGFTVQIPKILLVIDEYADLILQDYNKQFYNGLLRLTQKCRGADIYCALATQRPSADILRPSIKANFPARIACQVASSYDSRIVLDSRGAEELKGKGQAIIRNYKYDLVEFQAAWITAEKTTQYLQVENNSEAPITPLPLPNHHLIEDETT